MTGAAHRPSFLQRSRRLVEILGVFIFFGPPLGAAGIFLIIILTGALHEGLQSWQDLVKLAITPASWIRLPLGVLNFLVVSISMLAGFAVSGYMVGIAPALFAGLVVGIRLAFFGHGSRVEAALIGTLVGLPYSFVIGWPIIFIPLSMASIAMSVAACIVATMACWWIVQNWRFRFDKLASIET